MVQFRENMRIFVLIGIRTAFNESLKMLGRYTVLHMKKQADASRTLGRAKTELRENQTVQKL